jgi:hypothetical protein
LSPASQAETEVFLKELHYETQYIVVDFVAIQYLAHGDFGKIINKIVYNLLKTFQNLEFHIKSAV